MYTGLQVMYLLILSDFNELKFSGHNFQKLFKYQNFIKIHLVGAKLFHVNRWTDRETDMM